MPVEPTVRPKTIELKKSSGTRYEEGIAIEAITPGMLLEFGAGTADPGYVQRHSIDSGRAEVMIAREDALQGKTITQAYAADDPVGYGLYLPGDEVFLLLEAEENITRLDLLVSTGTGTFKGADAGTGDEEYIIAQAIETLDLTGEADTHIKARIVPMVAD